MNWIELDRIEMDWIGLDWIGGWMDGWTDGQTKRWMDEWTAGWTYACTCLRLSRYVMVWWRDATQPNVSNALHGCKGLCSRYL